MGGSAKATTSDVLGLLLQQGINSYFNKKSKVEYIDNAAGKKSKYDDRKYLKDVKTKKK